MLLEAANSLGHIARDTKVFPMDLDPVVPKTESNGFLFVIVARLCSRVQLKVVEKTLLEHTWKVGVRFGEQFRFDQPGFAERQGHEPVKLVGLLRCRDEDSLFRPFRHQFLHQGVAITASTPRAPKMPDACSFFQRPACSITLIRAEWLAANVGQFL